MATRHEHPPFPAGELPHTAQRRTALWRDRRLVALCFSQAVASVGLAAGAVAGPLLAEAVTGSPNYGPLPLGMVVVGAAASAPFVTRSMHQRGRVRGLAGCYLVAATGAAAVLAVMTAPLPESLRLVTLLFGCLLLGVGNTGVMLGRYAAADLAVPERRGEAMGFAMGAVTIGAVGGPALLGPAGTLSASIGLPASTGLFAIALVMFPCAAIVGLLAGRHTPVPGATAPDATGPAPTTARHPMDRWAPLLVLAVTNLTMVSVMGVMPNHLGHHGWSLTTTGLVVGMHIAAMFAPSPLTGRLLGRVGHRQVSLYGAVLTVAAMVVGVWWPADGNVLLLLLLGLGWNLQLHGGTAWLIAVTPAHERHRAEGAGEVVMGAGAAIGTLAVAGPVLAAGSLPALCLAFAALSACAAAAFMAEGRR